eukprot:6024656-Alexandrium_andersonii.AAC.1
MGLAQSCKRARAISGARAREQPARREIGQAIEPSRSSEGRRTDDDPEGQAGNEQISEQLRQLGTQ